GHLGSATDGVVHRAQGVRGGGDRRGRARGRRGGGGAGAPAGRGGRGRVHRPAPARRGGLPASDRPPPRPAPPARPASVRGGEARVTAGLPQWLRGFFPIAAAIPVLALLQLVVQDMHFLVYLASIVGVNVILAVSLNIVNGMTGQFSIGHAGFMAVGAYISGQFSLPMKDL